MLCKCHWIVLYTVYFTAFCLGGLFFSGHGVALRVHTSPAVWDHTVFTCHPTQVNAPPNNITRPQGPRVHLPVTYFLFHDRPFIWHFFASLRPKYGTHYLFTSANPKHTLPSDVILRHTTFFQPILPPSGSCNVTWFSSETLALYKSPYLLAYLLAYCNLCTPQTSHEV